jgi:hypothetical protein
MVECHEIQQGDHATEDDIDTIFSNPVASTVPKWQTFKLLRWMRNLNKSTWDHDILYDDRSSKDQQTLMGHLREKLKI